MNEFLSKNEDANQKAKTKSKLSVYMPRTVIECVG